MDKVHIPSDSLCYTQSSEPFRIDLNYFHLEIKIGEISKCSSLTASVV
jgi:hypothetical protein